MGDDVAFTGPTEVVLRFLESVGKRSDAEFYLSLFRASAKERFACICIDRPVISAVVDAVALDLRFLSLLGLTPVISLGLLDPTHAQAQAQALVGALTRLEVACALVPNDQHLLENLRRACRAGVLPIVALSHGHTTAVSRFDALAHVVMNLQIRKLIFLQRRGGLRHEGKIIPLVNLTRDFAHLAQSPELSHKQRFLLQHTQTLVCQHAMHKLAVAITSPLALLRELFTVKGAGTFLRVGAQVRHFQGWNGIDPLRLTELLGNAFGRPLTQAFFDKVPSRVYLEDEYRGAAVLMDTPQGAYLSKFAVDREAQGEGIGSDLWDALTEQTPAFFWRSRRENPIDPWYTKQCDGLLRVPGWNVFWKGLTPEAIAQAIAFARDQPEDFAPL